MSKNLIALVATAVMVDGVRTIIQPGEKLPELSSHDARELQQSGAAENPADTAALAKADARAQAAAAQEFEDARQRALQSQASTAATEAEADTDAAKAPTKTTAKK